MGKIETTLKSEITRLARKEVTQSVMPLQKQVRSLARQVRALVAENSRLTRVAKKLDSTRGEPVAQLTVPATELATSRMSGGLIKKLRGRHGITQAQLSQLVDVSAAAVQSWEQGIARPTGDNRTTLVALRKLSSADITKLMEDRGIAKAKRRPRTGKKAAAAAAPEAAKKVTRKKAAKKAKPKKAAKKVVKRAKRKRK